VRSNTPFKVAEETYCRLETAPARLKYAEEFNRRHTSVHTAANLFGICYVTQDSVARDLY